MILNPYDKCFIKTFFWSAESFFRRKLNREYDFIVHLIGGFNNIISTYRFRSSKMMKAHTTRHKESKWMLLHCSRMLSSSYVSRLDFLVKDCIFTMIAHKFKFKLTNDCS